MGKQNIFEVIKIAGDFGEQILSKTENTTSDAVMPLRSKFEELDISQNKEVDDSDLVLLSENNANTSENWKSYSANDIKTDAILLDSKLIYYVSQDETAIKLMSEEDLNDDTKNASISAPKEDKVSYESIGGLSAQLNAVRETIEMPLRFPDLFTACGKC